MENSIEIPFKTRTKTTIWLQQLSCYREDTGQTMKTIEEERMRWNIFVLLFWRTCLETYMNQFRYSIMSGSLQPHEPQHTRPPCPSPTPRACSNSCPSSRWCHPTISSSVIPFSFCLQSFPAAESFQMSQFFTSGGQSIGISASVLPMNTQDWSPLGWTGWLSLQSKGLSRVFSSTTVQKHQFFGAPAFLIV